MAQNYILLERIELNASAASVTFSNIPQSGYTDLKIVISARSTGSAGPADYGIDLSINGVTTNRTWRRLEAWNTTGATSDSGTNATFGIFGGASATANTFSNQEIYFPNYTSSNNKSFSAEFASESNSATAYDIGMFAGLWSSTAAITSIQLSAQSSSFTQYSTFSLYGLAAVGTTPAIAPKASGGNITTDGTYWYHTFLASDTFVPATALSVDYLVVAGGGGGGYDTAGGGGAGGLRCTVGATGGGGSLESKLSVTSGTSYTVTVGSGGAGSASGTSKGTNGSNSVFSSITSVGGGGGGSDSTGSGADGGSGGGKVNANRTGSGGVGTANQGYNGGTSTFLNGGGSGGGGAGAAGTGSTSTSGGAGGVGIATTISGSSTYYAGGGGGGGGPAGGAGGNGGGGQGGPSVATGTINTGGGGGGGYGSAPLSGAAGGSGIVIIRYAV